MIHPTLVQKLNGDRAADTVAIVAVVSAVNAAIAISS